MTKIIPFPVERTRQPLDIVSSKPEDLTALAYHILEIMTEASTRNNTQELQAQVNSLLGMPMKPYDQKMIHCYLKLAFTKNEPLSSKLENMTNAERLIWNELMRLAREWGIDE